MQKNIDFSLAVIFRTSTTRLFQTVSLLFVGLSLISSSLVYAEIENTPTTSMPEFRPGEIIAYFDSYGDLLSGQDIPDSPYSRKHDTYIYRKYLGTNKEGYYQIQDFYSFNQQKRTDPYQVKIKKELTVSHPQSIEGDIINYHKDGKIYIKGKYINSQKAGLWIVWYENGQMFSKGKFFKGKKNGLWTEWDDNGQKTQEVKYIHKPKDNLMSFWNGNEQKDVVILWTSYLNGQKKNESRFVNGKEDGLSTTWFENGQKRRELNYVNGQLEELVEWDKHGKKRAEGKYINDQKDRLWTEWDQNGQKIKELNYVSGQTEKLWVEWLKKGK